MPPTLCGLSSGSCDLLGHSVVTLWSLGHLPGGLGSSVCFVREDDDVTLQVEQKVAKKWQRKGKNLDARKVENLTSKVNRLNPGIRANDDFGQKLRKRQKCRARLVKPGFEALYEIDPKVKGTPFARFSNPINSGFYFCLKYDS